MFNNFIRIGRGWERICQGVRYFCLVSALLCLCSCSTTSSNYRTVVNSNNGGVESDAKNNLTVLLASQTVHPKLYRAIVTINMTNASGTKFYQHRYLLVKSIAGIRYIYDQDGSISVEKNFTNLDNTINYRWIGEGSFPDQVFTSVSIEERPMVQSRSDKQNQFVPSLNGERLERGRELPSICVIQAINHEAEIIESYKDKLAWHSILHIYYQKDGRTVGHAYCAYRVKNTGVPVGEEDFVRNQTFYVFDYTGTHRLNLIKYDPLTVAKELKPDVISARFDE